MHLFSIARRAADAVLGRLLPDVCAACDATLAQPNDLLCAVCEASVQQPAPRTVCDIPVIAPFLYEGPSALLIRRFKYERRPEIHRRLARVMARHATHALPGALLRGAQLVPAPMHPRRLAERGYNQAALLATTLGRELDVKVAVRALARRAHGPRQATLNREQRQSNLQSQISVRKALSGNLVLVDDVLTTGATARACVDALRAMGATPIAIVTAALAD